MTEWNTLRARFPDDELNDIERIKEQYGLSYNEIIRSGVKFYVGLTLVPAITGYLWILYKKGPHPIIKMITNFGVYFLAAVLKHEHSFRWSFFSVLKWKKSAFLGLAEKVKAKSLIETGQLEDTPISFLKYLIPEISDSELKQISIENKKYTPVSNTCYLNDIEFIDLTDVFYCHGDLLKNGQR